MYIERTLGPAIAEASETFYVVLLTGPRQVGKTTLLQNLQKTHRTYVSLDDFNARTAAENDPMAFIDRLTLPVLIDEIQYVPDLFPCIKMTVDKMKKPGLFWLTGSQQFDMMKNITESLAGRVAIMSLQGLSLAEEECRPYTPPFLPTVQAIKERQQIANAISIKDIYYKIWRGSYPHTVANQGKMWEKFYDSYVATYIERDVRNYININNLTAFRQFMRVVAARTGQKVNYKTIANIIGVTEPTIKSWFAVLRASGLIVFIEPYFNNLTKRLTKTPKFYFMDTGLCCFLTAWLTPEVLERGAMAGAMLETYVISEIIKSYIHHGRLPRLYYYHDKEQHEVDLLIEQDGTLYPVEIKKSASLKNRHFKNFDYLERLNVPIGHGGVLCFVNAVLPITTNIDAIPIGYL